MIKYSGRIVHQEWFKSDHILPGRTLDVNKKFDKSLPDVSTRDDSPVLKLF